MKRITRALLEFWKRETVLSIAIILAVVSMFIIPPDRGYIAYIDIRTLCILVCLMTVVAGLGSIGFFEQMAQGLLKWVKNMTGIVGILVLLCFFLSMLITNDVALITFVPLTIIVMRRLTPKLRQHWMLKTIVMQTIAANLGSMLTPIGNPQNLYLYEKSGIGILKFVMLMLPYTVMALILLVCWIGIAAFKAQRHSVVTEETSETSKKVAATNNTHKEMKAEGNQNIEVLIAYLLLFAISLLTVAHILPYWIPLVLVVLYTVIRKRQILKQVDYSLLGTFAALFIFIGNLGRIPIFSHALQTIIDGREILTAILASQVMSNVPAAILLSGFSDNYTELIVGVNLGGLGTLIASMASLISFKYVAGEVPELRGKYLLKFTVASLIFLGILLAVWYIL